MKNVKLVVLATMTILFLGISDLKAQSESEIVLIRTAEYVASAGRNSEMVTIMSSGERSVTELEHFRYSNYGEKAGENGAVIQQEIIKWMQQGFVITNFSTDGGDIVQRTFIIMTKE